MRIDERGRLTRFIRDDRIRIPHHLVIDAEDNLYTVSDDDGTVWRITPDGQLTAVHVRRGANAPQVGMWGDPFTIDALGVIYFVPAARGGIQRIVGGIVEPFADTTFAFNDLHASTMSWGPRGDLYVSDVTRVLRIAPDGSVSAVGEGRGSVLRFALGVAVDPGAHVYVADYRANRVVRIAPNGQSSSFGSGRFVRPSGVAIGPDGAAYVLDGRVWKIQQNGDISLIACAGPVPRPVEYGIVLLVPLLLAVWMLRRSANSLRDRLVRVILVGIVMYPMYFVARSGCSALELRYVVYALLVAAALWSLIRRTTRPA